MPDPRKDVKHYGSVIHTPIFSADNDDMRPVITILPSPELHLLTGPVNTLYDALNNVRSESERWLQSCNVKKTDYHGGSFAGNDSRALLKNTQILEDISPESCTEYVNAFKCFNKVVEACYGDKLISDFKNRIAAFARSFLKLKINVTQKVHAVIHHIPEFCSLTGRGLAPWSEQAGESVHHDFNQMWEKFKIKHVEN